LQWTASWDETQKMVPREMAAGPASAMTDPPAIPASEPPAASTEQSAQRELLIELMKRYQDADASAADELFRQVNPVLARYYYSLVNQPGQVEDLLQECWLRVHRARQSYRPGEPVLPWIVAIARHTRVDHFRRWQRSSGRESSIDALTRHPSTDPRKALDSRQRADAVRKAMETLPEGQREVLIMLKVTGMTAAEVARATGSTAAAVKQKAFRAYQAIRQALKMRMEPEENRDDLQGS
jgi:RNA polymerase sigma-70 factor (ECF subfamily)